jgi:hypothetical protein
MAEHMPTTYAFVFNFLFSKAIPLTTEQVARSTHTHSEVNLILQIKIWLKKLFCHSDIKTYYLARSRRWLYRSLSYNMWRCVILLVCTNVSEGYSASIFSTENEAER